jgi:hypothetical protein
LHGDDAALSSVRRSMNCIVAAHGLTPDRSCELRSILDRATPVGPDGGTGRGSGSWLVVVRTDDNAVGTAHDGPVRLAVFGTVPARRRGADEVARTLLDPAAGPGGQGGRTPDDCVVIRSDVRTGVMSAAVGAGWHRLFVAAAPDGGTVVSSNLGLLARLLGDGTGPDRSMEDFLLGFGFLPDDRTVHRNIRTLPPGEYRWGADDPAHPGSAGSAGSTPSRSAVSDRPVPSFDAAVRELHVRFTEVVEDLAGPSRDAAVLLGGFDSALVAATLARLGRRITTYTYGFGDPRYEQRNVALVTETVGSTERWVRIDPGTIMRGLESFGKVFPQPGPQPHYQIHTLAAAREIRGDGFDRVFTGDGCDAVFLGYPTVSRRARLMERLGALPRPVVSAALSVASIRAVDERLGHVARMLRSTLGTLELPMPARGHLPTRYLDDVALARLRTGTPPPQDETVDSTRLRLAAGLEDLDPVRLAFHGNSLTGQSRIKVDGTLGASGLRQYTPFSHPHLRDFVTSLPVEYLRPPGTSASAAGKALLVEMVRRNDLLPAAIVDMPKQSPADSPVDGWYSGPLRSEVLSLLESLPFAWDRAYVENLLRPKRAEQLYRERVAIAHSASQAVGLLASYASFHRR